MTAVSPTLAGGVQALACRFVENGAGTYTATFNIPAYSTLIDVIVEAEALWTAATSASLEVGDAGDPDGWFTSVDLKATDLLAGESVSLAAADVRGAVIGAYSTGTNTHLTRSYSEAARTITATVVSVGAGTAGRTRVTVLYAPVAPTEITQ